MRIARVRTSAAILSGDRDVDDVDLVGNAISSIRTRMDVEREFGAW